MYYFLYVQYVSLCITECGKKTRRSYNYFRIYTKIEHVLKTCFLIRIPRCITMLIIHSYYIDVHEMYFCLLRIKL